MRGTIDYAGNKIDYLARYSRRTTLAISVLPDGTVEIVVPEGAAKQDIERRLLRRAGWVMKQRRYFEQFRPRTPERRFVGGETHMYLGRQYRLKVEAGEQDRVCLKGGFFWVSVKGPPSPDRVRDLMAEWYRERADAKLKERYAVFTKRFGRLLPHIPTVAVAAMKRRWGSYSASGRITLNVDLVRAALPCIDYVIAHELAHARHAHHKRAFFDLLERMLPDWKDRKQRLERALS
jgi:predicted metal-dependent hydrolase